MKRLIVLAFIVLASIQVPATADHTSCRQYDSGDESSTFYGTSDCDEFWMRGGADVAWGYAGDDYLYMGGGTDVAHGGDDGDTISGGDNPTSAQEVIKAGNGNDGILDTTGPDWDLVCAGDGQDVADVRDGDGSDTAKGEAHYYGHVDAVWGDDGDNVQQDGSC